MILHSEISKESLRQMIRDGRVVLGGNLRLKKWHAGLLLWQKNET